MAQSLSGIFAGDEVMKGSLASYTFEHMEIASYTILIAAAESLGETEVVRACEENLREEVSMAEWLKTIFPRQPSSSSRGPTRKAIAPNADLLHLAKRCCASDTAACSLHVRHVAANK